MKEYKYDKEKFSSLSIYVIEQMINANVNDEILDIVTEINKNGDPVFSYNELYEIFCDVSKNNSSPENVKIYAVNNNGRSLYTNDQMHIIRVGLEEGLTIDEINIFARFNKENQLIYDESQMAVICYSLRTKIPMKFIELMSKLDKDMKPVYNREQMEQIQYGAKIKLPEKDILFYTKLNKDERPIYDSTQMYVVRSALELKLPLDEIEIFAKTKNEQPIFNPDDMYNLFKYVDKHSGSNEVKQIKECVEDGLTYNQFSIFIENELPADKIRVIKGFYNLNCSVEEVKNLADNIHSYENFKDIKYLLQCAKQLNITPKEVFCDFPGVTKNIEDMRKNLIEAICYYRHKDMHSLNTLDKILSYKMDPIQIDYITHRLNDFTNSQMKQIAIGILNGLTLSEINIAQHISDNTHKPLAKCIAEVTDAKFTDISNIDKGINIKTDWFDEKDKFIS